MSRRYGFVLAMTVGLSALGCERQRSEAGPIPSSSTAAAPATAPSAKPITLSGIALKHAAEFGVGQKRSWSITFNQVENPEEAAQWGKGIRGFDFTATALPQEPEAEWRKVGPGDRVMFECTTRERVQELSGCKLAGFQDTSYSLRPVANGK